MWPCACASAPNGCPVPAALGQMLVGWADSPCSNATPCLGNEIIKSCLPPQTRRHTNTKHAWYHISPLATHSEPSSGLFLHKVRRSDPGDNTLTHSTVVSAFSFSGRNPRAGVHLILGLAIVKHSKWICNHMFCSSGNLLHSNPKSPQFIPQ